MIDYGKIPPQAIDLEKAVLGVLLIESDSHEYIERLTSEMFYTEANQTVFTAINELRLIKSPIDILTVTEYLNITDKLELVGGAIYVTKLTSNVVTSNHIDKHIAIVKQKYIQREIIRISSELQTLSFNGDNIEECQTMLSELNQFIDTNIVGEIQGSGIFDIAQKNINSAATRMVNYEKGVINGINTGFGLLQQITGGWQKQDLVYIASRPSMGKTAISIHFTKAAVKRGYKVLFFSLEMSDISIIDRMILGETDINPEDWRNGRISESDLQAYEEMNSVIRSWKLKVFDKPGIKPSQINAICRKETPDMIVIDYIQLMKADSTNYQNRNLELGSISRDLKGTAKEFNIPVIALAQLNRGIDSRGVKVPVLSDLRDSGELEQDADIVMFPYRPYVYSSDPKHKEAIDLIIAKHRNGRLGIVNASHNEYINNFFDKKIEYNNDLEPREQEF